MDGTYAVGIVCTILGGVFLSVQSGVNASLGVAVGSKAFASVVSFTVGSICCCIYLLIDTTALKHQLPSATGIMTAPWWTWIGGFLGAYYVVVVIIFAQKLGAGTLVAIFVCAQLITSVILDLTGIVGFSRRVFSWQRWVGAALMIAGVLLVTQFPGETVAAVQLKQQQDKQSALGIDGSNSSSSGSSMGHTSVAGGNLTAAAPAAAAGVGATTRALLGAADVASASVRDQEHVDMLVQLAEKV